MQGTNIIRKAHKNHGTEIILLIIDIICNAILGVVCVFGMAIPGAWMYSILGLVCVGLVSLIDIIEIIVAFIMLSNSDSVYIAYTSSDLIIHYPNSAKCVTIPYANITEVKKRRSGSNIFGSIIKMFLGTGVVSVSYRVANGKIMKAEFGAINNCGAFVDSVNAARLNINR